MSAADTTFALLTPPAAGGIAVIRLAGDGCIDLLRRICFKPHGDAPPEFSSGRLTHCRLMDGVERLDDVIVAPCLHVGQPAAEICLHGGVRVVQRAVLLLQRCGARGPADASPAAPGPAGEDAIAAIDALLPRATTRRMARWLLRQRAMLPEYLARLCGQSGPPVAKQDQHDFLRRSAVARHVLRGLRIAIVGPPNAGKSTLANALIGHDRLITSQIPGTTRDWVDETANIDGWPVTLTDTAGVRATDDALESTAIQRGFERAVGADLLLIVLDATSDAALHDAWPASIRRLIVHNKADLLDDRSTTGVPASRRPLLISALTGQGIDELERRLAESLGLTLLQDDLPAAPWPLRVGSTQTPAP